MSRIGELLERARKRIDRLDAQLLLAHRLGRPRAWLLAHDADEVDAAGAAAFEADVATRAGGVPLAYLTGRRGFHGIELAVDARVLVPRPETELLVDWAIDCLRGRPAAAVIDLGTGSGAIVVALAVSNTASMLHLTATDASAAALEVARANAAAFGVAIDARQGDWWAAVEPGRRFDLAISNPPYIAAGDIHLQALRAEPLAALSPGPTGLEAIERIIAGAPDHLNPGAQLLLEHGFDQAQDVRSLLQSHGFEAVETRHDFAGHERATGARLSAAGRQQHLQTRPPE